MPSYRFVAARPAACRLSAAGALLLVAGAAHAQGNIHFSIPAERMQKALEDFGRQSGLQLGYDARLVGTLHAPAVVGDYSPEHALSRLLAGSGLGFRRVDHDTWVVGVRSTRRPHVQGKGRTRSDEKFSGVTVTTIAVPESPSSAPLDVIQPTSIINRQFIDNSVVPTGNYDETAKFAPSVFVQTPAGPGLGKSETVSIRGFQDGQYNLTFDGIPFGDATDLHHTSAALFMARDLGEARIERGPGTAATIGNATFGGTLGLMSKHPDSRFSVEPYTTVGSFGTAAGGAQLNTGETRWGNAYFNVDRAVSQGYLSYDSMRRSNYFLKTVSRLGDDTFLTVVGTYNHTFQYTPQGTTLANIRRFGPDYAFSNDPTVQNYWGYNGSNYYSDFEYIGLDSRLGSGWHFEDKLYTNAFGHSYNKTSDASDSDPASNGVTVYNPDGSKTQYPNDVPGKRTNAAFRAFGNVLRLSKRVGFGTLRAGLWFDRNNDRRYSLNVDYTRGGVAVPGKYGTAYKYDYDDSSTTIQPYVQVDWKLTPSLTLSPGVRYTQFERGIDATLNKSKPPAPLDYSETYHALQPSVAAHWRIRDGWSSYLQVAKGFLAPPIDVFQVNVIGSVRPESTWNYQLGTAWQGRRLAFGADVYYIDFSNYIAESQIAGTSDSTFVNGGGAVYEGLEAEGTYDLGDGFSTYANGSINSAKYKDSSVQIAGAPRWTGAAGLLFDQRRGPFFSLLGKYVGPQFGQDSGTDASGNTVFADSFPVHSFFTADLAGGYRFRHVGRHIEEIDIKLNVYNVFDTHAISGFAGTQDATGDPLYWTVPGRSLFLNVAAKLF